VGNIIIQMPRLEINLSKRLRYGAALAGGIAIFVGVFIGVLNFYRSSGLPVGFVVLMSIAHAAMGLGFFVGFMIMLSSRRTDQKERRREKVESRLG